jgi:hypothetical protein
METFLGIQRHARVLLTHEASQPISVDPRESGVEFHVASSRNRLMTRILSHLSAIVKSSIEYLLN